MRQDGDPAGCGAREHVDGPAGPLDRGHSDHHTAVDGHGRGGSGSVPTRSVDDREAAHEQRRGSQAQAPGGTADEEGNSSERMLGNPLFASVQDLERRHTRPLAMARDPKMLLEASKNSELMALQKLIMIAL